MCQRAGADLPLPGCGRRFHRPNCRARCMMEPQPGWHCLIPPKGMPMVPAPKLLCSVLVRSSSTSAVDSMVHSTGTCSTTDLYKQRLTPIAPWPPGMARPRRPRPSGWARLRCGCGKVPCHESLAARAARRPTPPKGAVGPVGWTLLGGGLGCCRGGHHGGSRGLKNSCHVVDVRDRRDCPHRLRCALHSTMGQG